MVEQTGVTNTRIVRNERMIIMVAITKKEKEAIVAQFPHAHIARTMRQKSKRHHYYCEERAAIMRFLDDYRNGRIAEVGGVYGFNA